MKRPIQTNFAGEVMQLTSSGFGVRVSPSGDNVASAINQCTSCDLVVSFFLCQDDTTSLQISDLLYAMNDAAAEQDSSRWAYSGPSQRLKRRKASGRDGRFLTFRATARRRPSGPRGSGCAAPVPSRFRIRGLGLLVRAQSPQRLPGSRSPAHTFAPSLAAAPRSIRSSARPS
jgi:hypothetical protein